MGRSLSVLAAAFLIALLTSVVTVEARGQARGFGRFGTVSPATGRVYQEPAYARGYADGFQHGQDDRQDGRRYDPVRHRDYRDGDQGFGSRDAYKDNYRAGFRAGYDAGYRDPSGARP